MQRLPNWKGTHTQHFSLCSPGHLFSSIYIPQCMPDNQLLHGAIIVLRPCIDIRDGVPLAAT